jgi:hypothetical protein
MLRTFDTCHWPSRAVRTPRLSGRLPGHAGIALPMLFPRSNGPQNVFAAAAHMFQDGPLAHGTTLKRLQCQAMLFGNERGFVRASSEGRTGETVLAVFYISLKSFPQTSNVDHGTSQIGSGRLQRKQTWALPPHPGGGVFCPMFCRSCDRGGQVRAGGPQAAESCGSTRAAFRSMP